jgi:epoxide hydrolase-like predicted phosphatase
MTDDSVESATSPGTVPTVADAMTEPGAARLRGVIFDWGGVLTPALDGVMSRWARSDGADIDHLRAVLRDWSGSAGTVPGAGTAVPGPAREVDPVPDSPTHRLERGEIDVVEFEILLADELARRGSTVRPDGLLDRLLAGLGQLDERMLRTIRRIRAAGYATALLSNSWGDHYPEQLWQGLFDAIVISGRVGMRKPEERIFRYTADQLGLDPAQCVMVDDLVGNVVGAAATGMVGIVHVSWAETLGELEIILDRDLREQDPL